MAPGREREPLLPLDRAEALDVARGELLHLHRAQDRDDVVFDDPPVVLEGHRLNRALDRVRKPGPQILAPRNAVYS